MVERKDFSIAKAVVETLLNNLNTRKQHIHVITVICLEENAEYSITLERKHFADTLQENLKYYVENEQYEEDRKLLIKDKLKGMFFNEEIVNPDNKGKLTPQNSNPRAKSRDNIKKSLKNVKVIKGPPGRMDTPEEAKYRLATFIELNKKKN